MAKIDLLRRESHFPNREAQVAIHRQPVQSSIGPHRHEFIELVIILSGQGVHVTEGLRHQVQAGDVLVINSSRSHAYEETRSLNLVNILIREDVFRETEKELGSLPGYHALFTFERARWRQREFRSHLRLKAEDLRRVVGWLDALEEETRKAAEGGLLLARSWIILIIGLMARCYGNNASHAPRLEMRLGRVLSWIEQQACEKLTVAELSARAAMSERTFLRRFREATGVSPIEYVTRARIRRATEWLGDRRTGLTITEVAFRCGFQDSNYFSRKFRQVMGTSPRRYRDRRGEF
jgi:AraC-like DNA-binding protein/mannose-6-phosphate isomerase-like protein (cupin superfamily)